MVKYSLFSGNYEIEVNSDGELQFPDGFMIGKVILDILLPTL